MVSRDASQTLVGILAWSSGLLLLGLPLTALAQKAPLKGGVEQSDIRRPDGSDPYLTDGKCMATCGAAREWLKTDYSQDERQRTSGCLSLLDSAHTHEQAMIDLQKQADAAAAAHDYRRRDDLIKQAHDESVLRSNDLHAFGDCLKKARVTTTRKGTDTQSTPKNSGQPDQSGLGNQDAGGSPSAPGGTGNTGGRPTPGRPGDPNRAGGGGPGNGTPGNPSNPGTPGVPEPPRTGPPANTGQPQPQPPPQQPLPQPPPQTSRKPTRKAPAPCIAPPPPDVRDALLKAAAELDKIATNVQANELAAGSEFFRGLADTVSADLKFLAQHPGDPAQQLLEGAIKYVNNDAVENDRRLRLAAEKSIEQFRKNPAYFLGSIVPVATMMVCEGPGAKGAVDASRIAEAENAERRLLTINRNAQRFIDEAPHAPPSYGSGDPKLPPGVPSLQNYFCGKDNCFQVMKADFDTRLGKDPLGRPYVALDVPAGPGDVLPVPVARAIEIIRKSYGGRVSDPSWGLDRALNQLWGVPTESSITEIAGEIERADVKALGGVFVETPLGDGHILGVRQEAGKAYFYDPQLGKEGAQLANSLAHVKRVWFYRVN